MTEPITWSARALWALLIALTLLTASLAELSWFGLHPSVVIILIAAFKSRLVILHYMEARRAPGHWRFLYETWNVAVAGTLIMGYFMAQAQATPMG